MSSCSELDFCSIYLWTCCSELYSKSRQLSSDVTTLVAGSCMWLSTVLCDVVDGRMHGRTLVLLYRMQCAV